MFQEEHKKGEASLLERYLEKEPSVLEKFSKVVSEFSFDNFKSACESDPRFRIKYEEIISHAKAYTEKVISMQELIQRDIYTNAELMKKFEELRNGQSADKDALMQAVEELHENMQKENAGDVLSPLLGRSSSFNNILAMDIAFSSIQPKM